MVKLFHRDLIPVYGLLISRILCFKNPILSFHLPLYRYPINAMLTTLFSIDLKFIISSLILLFFITDPLGNIPFFISELKKVTPERRRQVIYRECAIATLILLFFMFTGKSFLAMMKLSDHSLQIAGGVILFLIAIQMIFPSHKALMGADHHPEEPFIVPLAIPLIAGPSAMATVLLLSSQHPEQRFELIIAILLSMLITMSVFLSSSRLQKYLGIKVITAMERLMGLILTTLAIEMLLQGIRAFIRTLS
jgi:MarC family membrane protein